MTALKQGIEANNAVQIFVNLVESLTCKTEAGGVGGSEEFDEFAMEFGGELLEVGGNSRVCN